MNSCQECGMVCSNKFCSSSCAAKYNNRKRAQGGWKHTDETKAKLRQSAQKQLRKPKKPPLEKVQKNCPTCSSCFFTYPHLSDYCSGKCNPNVGGYRNGSGRSKSGYYKGIYCGSQYELVWMIYQIDHAIEFSRFPTVLVSNGKKYYPDFLQDGKIIELKGYENQDSVDAKTKIANDNGYDVIVKRLDDLSVEFDYVKSTYGTDKFYTLYDGHVPEYKYVCSHCSLTFLSEVLKKTEEVYCSRVCSGKRRKHINSSNPETFVKISEALKGRTRCTK